MTSVCAAMRARGGSRAALAHWTTCSSARRHSAGHCFVPDCERSRSFAARALSRVSELQRGRQNESRSRKRRRPGSLRPVCNCADHSRARNPALSMPTIPCALGLDARRQRARVGSTGTVVTLSGVTDQNPTREATRSFSSKHSPHPIRPRSRRLASGRSRCFGSSRPSATRTVPKTKEKTRLSGPHPRGLWGQSRRSCRPPVCARDLASLLAL
jgi:hypothetical protein